MTLGRTSSGSIKIKTDEPGGGLRAVECACCGGCNLPDVCLEGFPNMGWYGDWDGTGTFCETFFPDIPGCFNPPVLFKDYIFGEGLCGGATQWAIIISASGGECLGSWATNFYCKDDGIDSPIGTYSGYNYGDPNGGILSLTVTEKQGETC